MAKIFVYLLMMLFMCIRMRSCNVVTNELKQDADAVQQQEAITSDSQEGVIGDEQEDNAYDDEDTEEEVPYNWKELYEDVLDPNLQLDLLSQSDLVKTFDDIMNEMRNKNISSISYKSQDTKDLFLRLYQCLQGEWFPKDYLDEITKEGNPAYYMGYCFNILEEEDLSFRDSEDEQYIPYCFYEMDEVGGEGCFLINDFHIDKKDSKKFYITYRFSYDNENKYYNAVIDFSDSEHVKFIYSGNEYFYLGTSLTNFINQTLFVGKYVDQDGDRWEFTDDYKMICDDQTFFYDPLYCSLDIDYGTLCFMDSNFDNLEAIGFDWKPGELSLYHLYEDENSGNRLKEKAPYAVLTRIE